MKKKLLALSLILSIVFSVMLSTAYAENTQEDLPCGGAIELVDIKVLFTPISNLISISETKPSLTGTVLKITYPDGTNEIVTIEKTENGYFAGKFSINYYTFDGLEMGEIINYGLVSKKITADSDDGAFEKYSGDFEFIYLHLPSFEDIYYMIF